MSETNGEHKAKWDDLDYRVMPRVRAQFAWMRCQVGRVSLEKRVAKYPPQAVFELLGYAANMVDAEQMAERRLGR